MTQPGAALPFYGVLLRDPRTPQAKGRLNRRRQCWHGRLPALVAADTITAPAMADALSPALRRHRTPHQSQRELARAPTAAARAAQRE